MRGENFIRHLVNFSFENIKFLNFCRNFKKDVKIDEISKLLGKVV